MLRYPIDISDDKYLTILKSNIVYILISLKDIIIEFKKNNNNNQNWWITNRQITKTRR
jgi:hypothetical protein